MVALSELTVNAQPRCSSATMKRWLARLPTKNKQLAKKNRPTLTPIAHSNRLQIILMKNAAIRAMLVKHIPKPRKSVKRQYDTFNDHKDDPSDLYISGRRFHKKRRTKNPEADRILQKFRSDPYGRLFQSEDVIETSDSAISRWWQCLQALDLWPILPAGNRSAKPETEFFFNVILKKNCSTNSQFSGIDGQDSQRAEERDAEEDSDMHNDRASIAQEHMEEMLDLTHEDQIQDDKVRMEIAHGQSPEDLTSIYNPEEVSAVVQTGVGGAGKPIEYSPAQPWLVQVDIANIAYDHMEAEVAANAQELLEGVFSEQEGLPFLSPAPGPIRTSASRAQKWAYRSFPYEKPPQKPLKYNTKKGGVNRTGEPECPDGSNDISAKPLESDAEQTLDVETEDVQHLEFVESTPPCNHQINCLNLDDSGYVSDDGLDEAFAEAAKEISNEEASIEKDRLMYPWKPRVSSPLKYELNVQNELPPKMYPSRSHSPKNDRLQTASNEGRNILNEMDLILHLSSRSFNKEGAQTFKEHCGIADHRQRYRCRCRSTAAARGVLRISLGHLTPERVRKATHEQLRRIALLDNSYINQKEKACDAVKSAYRTLEKLDYAVSCLRSGVPGLADLEYHAKRIYKTHKLVHNEYLQEKYGFETEEQQEQRAKRQLIQNKGRITPPARRIAKAPRRDKCQHCKKLLVGQQPWDSGWHRHLKEERTHAFHTMPMWIRRGMRDPECLFSRTPVFKQVLSKWKALPR